MNENILIKIKLFYNRFDELMPDNQFADSEECVIPYQNSRENFTKKVNILQYFPSLWVEN